MAIEYSHLTHENFHIHKNDIMASEDIFPEDIRETPENYLDILRYEEAIGLVATVDSSYIGNILGFSPSEETFAELRLDEIPADKMGLIYLYNIVTMPQFQAKGYGREMLSFFIEKAADAGFRKVGGHFRGNGSLKNFRNLGGEEVAVFKDWFGTGEEYIYCELPISRVPHPLQKNLSLHTVMDRESASFNLSQLSPPL